MLDSEEKKGMETSLSASKPDHNSIVISGGGIYGVMVLGALQFCIDAGIVDMNSVDLFVGTSIGSIICYLLVMGLFPTEIVHLLIRHRRYLESLASVNVVKMYNLEGGVPFTGVQSALERATLDRTGTLFTLKTFYERYERTLVCTAYNYTLKKVEYLSWKTHPDMPCLLAVQASCSIPIVFGKCTYGGSCYIDGAIHDNLPIDYPILACDKPYYPLCFNIEFRNSSYKPDEKLHIYVYELYKIAINAGARNKCEIFKDKARIFKIKPGDNHPMWWSVDNITDILDMFSDGYTGAAADVNTSPTPTPV